MLRVDCRQRMRFVHTRQTELRKTNDKAGKIPHSGVKVKNIFDVGDGIGVLHNRCYTTIPTTDIS